MFCGNCGCEVTEGMHYCSNCGAKLEVVISPVQRPEDRAAAREEAEPYIPASQAAEPEPAIPAGSAPGIAPGQTAAQVPGSGAPQAAPSAPDPTVYQPPTASAAPFSVPAASAVPFSGPAANTVRGVNAPFAWIAAAAALAALAAQFRTGNALSQIFLTSLELLVLMLTAISASKQIRLTALPALIHLIVLGISVYQAARATSANLTLMSGYLRSQALTLIVYLLFLIAVFANGRARQIFGGLSVIGFAFLLVRVLSALARSYAMQQMPDPYMLMSMLVSVFAYLSYLVLSVGVFCMRNREKAQA